LEKALTKIDQTKQRLIRIFADPDIAMTKGEFISQKGSLDEEQAEIKQRLAELDRKLAELPSYENIEQIKRYSEEIRVMLLNKSWLPTIQNMRNIFNVNSG
jgi:multidrug resistance efflux pump